LSLEIIGIANVGSNRAPQKTKKEEGYILIKTKSLPNPNTNAKASI
jgi:hypothetical protein